MHCDNVFITRKLKLSQSFFLDCPKVAPGQSKSGPFTEQFNGLPPYLVPGCLPDLKQLSFSRC